MKAVPSLLVAVVALSSAFAHASDARSGPGMMRCSVVLNRLASADAADRLPVLSWSQGYLSGIASVASAFDGTSDVVVPTYDELQPRLVALCKADSAMDLAQATRRLSSRRNAGR